MGGRPSKASAPATPPPSEAILCSSLWSDLPPELAGLVLRRMPSLADRVRFGSVCRHWRHAAQQQAPVLPPVLPWTITYCTGIVQTIPDGEVHRLCSGILTMCPCSSEDWLFMIGRASRDDTKRRNFLANPLSGATLPLPCLLHPGGDWVTKFIVRPDDNLVVAIIRNHIPRRGLLIACCRPGWSSWSMSSQAAAAAAAVVDDDRSCYEDIAFHGRSIYAITERGDLFAHEVSEEHGRHGVLSSGKLVIKGGDTSCFGIRKFLMVSRRGSLLMVKWNGVYDIYDDGDISAFKVFEADMQTSRWSRLSSIADQVLFVSQRCSKAVPAVSDHDDYLRGNRIYFLDIAPYAPKKCRVGAASYGMYDMGNNRYHPIVSDKFHVNHVTATAWFFPHK